MNSTEKAKFQAYVNANMVAMRAALKSGAVVSSADKQANFTYLRGKLRDLQIAGTSSNITEAAGLVGRKQKIKIVDFVAYPVPVEEVLEVNIAKEIKSIKDDVGHGIEITQLAGRVIPAMYVQLDDAQMKHQPPSVPIGTRTKEGEKFGTYATKAWHEANTMLYMAQWAYGLANLVEGKKSEHGQAEKIQHPEVGPISYEGFCMLLGGKRYVSFHCYPNSR